MYLLYSRIGPINFVGIDMVRYRWYLLHGINSNKK